jgi:hypothetical protein
LRLSSKRRLYRPVELPPRKNAGLLFSKSHARQMPQGDRRPEPNWQLLAIIMCRAATVAVRWVLLSGDSVSASESSIGSPRALVSVVIIGAIIMAMAAATMVQLACRD